MSISTRISGASLAAATALLFAAGVGQAAEGDQATQEAQVNCYGINACKGQGSCATATNACQGQNSCKGKGVVRTTEAECKDKGGEVRK
jgi:uncharacterized membrane protein